MRIGIGRIGLNALAVGEGLAVDGHHHAAGGAQDGFAYQNQKTESWALFANLDYDVSEQLNALAANSPFWFGKDSGLASARTVLFRSYPRAAMAPEFADFDEFTSVTRQVCRAAGLADYTHIWWDARIHPGLGTIEIRAADTQTELWRAEAIAALTHCLVRLEAERSQADLPAREALAESTFQASRHGLDAELLDRDLELVPARELARRRVEEVAECGSALNCSASLARVLEIVSRDTGAAWQRRVQAERGTEHLLEALVERTAALATNG